MKPGRELDALVAEKVMGWKLSKEGKRTLCTPPKGMNENPVYAEHLPKYSTNIAAAWTVFDRVLKEKNGEISYLVRRGTYTVSVGNYLARIDENGREVLGASNGDILAEAETAAEAICLAALKAVGYRFAEEE